jgi:hypothetical protein
VSDDRHGGLRRGPRNRGVRLKLGLHALSR